MNHFICVKMPSPKIHVIKNMVAHVKKVGFVSLGCPKALVDSERIITQLRSEGYSISPTYADADCVVINTCGFIDSAVAESLDAIGEAIAENGKVIVTGCLGAKKDLILEKHPEVLSVTGAHAYEDVVSAVRKHCPQEEHNPFVDLLPPQGIKLTPRHYAYLKISEGCHHKCRFCIIPQFRGTLVSRPIDEVLLEAQRLANAGVKECLVISQDTSAYGLDLKYLEKSFKGKTRRTNFYDLAQGLGELNMWIRMHYVYPYPHVDQVIPLMAEGAILPYLDIPFQHADPEILKLMRRPANAENVLKRIHSWREICPDITLRSTFIVGFPGETEAAFERLLDFMSEAQLDRVGCFAYSPVEGATANELPNPVPEEVKQERLERFMLHQAKISTAKLTQKVGKTLQVLIDEIHPDHVVARSKGDAPEIDGLVLIEPHRSLKKGEFATVIVTDSNEHDLMARVAS